MAFLIRNDVIPDHVIVILTKAKGHAKDNTNCQSIDLRRAMPQVKNTAWSKLHLESEGHFMVSSRNLFGTKKTLLTCTNTHTHSH